MSAWARGRSSNPSFSEVLESYTFLPDKKTKKNHDRGIWTEYDISWPWHRSLAAPGERVPAGDQAGVWWTLEVASTRLPVTQQNNDAPAREPEPSWGRCGTGGGLLCSVWEWRSPASMWCLVRQEAIPSFVSIKSILEKWFILTVEL